MSGKGKPVTPTGYGTAPTQQTEAAKPAGGSWSVASTLGAAGGVIKSLLPSGWTASAAEKKTGKGSGGTSYGSNNP